MHTSTAPNLPGTLPAPGVPPAPMSSEQVRETLTGKHVCPFCGSVNDTEHGVCVRCAMENSAATRKATRQRIGPWYVLQSRNPAAPGMRFETLLAFVRKGRVKPKSVVRGPTTHQLWKFAAHVKGLSREFGLCYSCGGAVEPGATLCPHCNHSQEPPPNPDVLLETTREAPPPAAVAPASPASPPARGAAAGHREPSLEAGDADFNPAPGARSDDSLAGFALGGSMAGVNANPAWARIDPSTKRPRAARPEGEPQGAQAYSAPGRSAPRPAPPGPGDSFAGYPAIPGTPAGGNGDRRRREREAEGGFLSAKDLAAAFKLDFAGDAAAPEPAYYPAAGAGAAAPPQPARLPGHGYPQPHAPVQPRGQVPSSIPASLREPVRRRRRFGVLKVLLLLLATCGVLYGTAIWIDEGFRRDSFAWFARLKASLLDPAGGAGRGRPSAPAGDAGDARNGPAPGARGSAAATPPGRPDGAAPSQYSPSDRTVDTDPFEDGAPELASSNVAASETAAPPPAATRPAAATRPSAPPAASPASQPGLPLTSGVPEAQTAFVSPPSASAPADGQSAAQIRAAEMTMWKLYREAMDLERTDAARAAAKYREIKTLPPEVWPKDLDTRIREAEKLHRIRNPGS